MSDDLRTTGSHTTDSRDEVISPHRLLALTDGVIAIAMTLLALDLKPEIAHVLTSGKLAHYLYLHLGQYASFAIAFALIAQYWVSHHRVMRTVRAVTPRLVAATMLFLFAITLIPLTTYLNGNLSNPLAKTIFAANIFLVGITLILMGETIHRHDLDDRKESDADRVRRRWRGFMSLAIPALVAGLSWVIGSQAAWFYLVFYAADLPGALAARRVASVA